MTGPRVFLAALTVGLAGFLLSPAPAIAAEPNTGPTPGLVTIPDFYLTFIVATLLPILVGFVRTRYGSSRLGALLLLAFSTISGWLTSLYATGGEFDIKTAVVAVVVSFITAAGSHYGFLKPAGVTGSEGVVQKAVPGGIGGSSS